MIRANENLRKNLKKLEEMGNKYILKANDKFLSGWGRAENKKHLQLIACVDRVELEEIKNDLEKDSTFNYINWENIKNVNNIYNWTRDKTYTIRNDWTRHKKQ